MPTFLTACPRNCYSTCSMSVTVEDNRVVKIEGVPENLATPEGPCIKGLAYVERANSKDRIVQPMRRTASGDFEPIAWDEAIETIASKLESARARFGPQSVFYYSASGTKGLLNEAGLAFWRLFGGCTTTYGDLCWPAGLEATRLTLGDNSHNAPWDLANAKLIVLWGRNSAETNIHQMLHVDLALEAGGKLVVVDPRRTETGERADLLLQLRPGTDGALALGVGHILIRDGHVDRSFVDANVLGFDEYAQLAADFTPQRTSEITGLRIGQIETFAELLGATKPATISAGFGMQRFTNSGQAMRAMLALLAITGNVGRPGAGWVYANLQTHVFSPVKDPIAFYPPADQCGPGTPACGTGTPACADSEKPASPVRVSVSTAKLGRDMLAQHDPPLAFAWVERGNPIPQNPETHRVVEAFRKLEFRVVVDEFMTDTAREADIVLPAKNLFEQTDVIGAYWHPYLQIRPRIVSPAPGVKPETEIYRVLGRRLGIDEALLSAAIPGPSDEAIEEWLEGRLAKFGITLDQLRRGPVLAPGFNEIAFADLRFPTPSGRIELRSAEARERWGLDELPAYREPEEKPGGRFPLHILTPNTKNRIHSQFGNLETIRRMESGPPASSRPVWRHPAAGFDSEQAATPGRRRTGRQDAGAPFVPAPFVSMHPADAKKRGLSEGDEAKVWNDRGSLTLPVKFDFGLRPGCVSITNGFWLTEGAAVNVLSMGRETDMGYGAAFHDNAVEVTRA